MISRNEIEANDQIDIFCKERKMVQIKMLGLMIVCTFCLSFFSSPVSLMNAAVLCSMLGICLIFKENMKTESVPFETLTILFVWAFWILQSYLSYLQKNIFFSTNNNTSIEKDVSWQSKFGSGFAHSGFTFFLIFFNVLCWMLYQPPPETNILDKLTTMTSIVVDSNVPNHRKMDKENSFEAPYSDEISSLSMLKSCFGIGATNKTYNKETHGESQTKKTTTTTKTTWKLSEKKIFLITIISLILISMFPFDNSNVFFHITISLVRVCAVCVIYVTIIYYYGMVQKILSPHMIIQHVLYIFFGEPLISLIFFIFHFGTFAIMNLILAQHAMDQIYKRKDSHV